MLTPKELILIICAICFIVGIATNIAYIVVLFIKGNRNAARARIAPASAASAAPDAFPSQGRSA